MARPQVELDHKVVRDLAAIGCTMKEIAVVQECSVATLERHCADIIKAGRENFKTSVRRLAWKQANLGNSTALRFLFETVLDWKPASTIDLKAYTTSVKDLSNEQLATTLESKAKELREVKEEGSE